MMYGRNGHRDSRAFRDRPMRLTREFTAVGIPHVALSRAIAAGSIKRLSQGVYSLADFRQSEHGDLVLVARKVAGAVICLLSALRLHKLTIQAPYTVCIALPNKAGAPRLEYPELTLTRFGGASFGYGVMTRTIEGVQVRVSTIEKTIVDCLKFRNMAGLVVAPRNPARGKGDTSAQQERTVGLRQG